MAEKTSQYATKKPNDLGDFLTSINKTKRNLIREAEDPAEMTKKYPAWVVRALLSYHPDSLIAVEALNQLPHLDPDLQYEFLLGILPKQNRFAKLYKEDVSENVDLIMRRYNYSTKKALEVLDLHTDEDMDDIRAQLDEGGVIRKK